ncbi:MAG: glycosyl transferase family 2 [Solirubrobacterales bacterium]|nr:glycosyl transferase family 2 [Solirubrobacterales bacterium]
MSDPPVSVVIRVKDEAAALERTLGLLARQTVASEVVVVDSGSTDGSVDVVRASGARLIEIPAAAFTFGGALNTGAERATSEVVVALSAHSFPKDDGWLARMLAAMADPNVACASGQHEAPGGGPLGEDVVQDLALAREHPLWGYSSHAGAFRRSLWVQRPFRTDMTACEDKEWAWRWLERGYTAVLGPGLTVDHSHADDPAGSQFDRAYREWSWAGAFAPVPRQPVSELAARWWREREGYPSAWRARLSPKRLGRLIGEFAGRRAAARRAA